MTSFTGKVELTVEIRRTMPTNFSKAWSWCFRFVLMLVAVLLIFESFSFTITKTGIPLVYFYRHWGNLSTKGVMWVCDVFWLSLESTAVSGWDHLRSQLQCFLPCWQIGGCTITYLDLLFSTLQFRKKCSLLILVFLLPVCRCYWGSDRVYLLEGGLWVVAARPET